MFWVATSTATIICLEISIRHLTIVHLTLLFSFIYEALMNKSLIIICVPNIKNFITHCLVNNEKMLAFFILHAITSIKIQFSIKMFGTTFPQNLFFYTCIDITYNAFMSHQHLPKIPQRILTKASNPNVPPKR